MLLEDYGTLGRDINAALAEKDSSKALAAYIDLIVKLALGFASIGAVILLVWGGVEYITAQTFTNKSGGKDKIGRALGALAILFTSFIVFLQLNPELLKVRFEPLNVGGSGSVDLSLSTVVFGSDLDGRELEEATAGFSEGDISDGNACAAASYRKKAEIYRGLSLFLGTANRIESEGHHTITVNDFSEKDHTK